MPLAQLRTKRISDMSFAQQIYVTCVFKSNLLYLRRTNVIRISGDDDIRSNYTVAR